MGNLADVFRASATKPTTTADIQSILAQRRPVPGQTVVQVRIDVASQGWDGTV